MQDVFLVMVNFTGLFTGVNIVDGPRSVQIFELPQPLLRSTKFHGFTGGDGVHPAIEAPEKIPIQRISGPTLQATSRVVLWV